MLVEADVEDEYHPDLRCLSHYQTVERAAMVLELAPVLALAACTSLGISKQIKEWQI